MVSFRLQIKDMPWFKHTNVLHFTTGGNNDEYGSRIPAVYVDRIIGDKLRIRICTALRTKRNIYEKILNYKNFCRRFIAEMHKKYDITIKQWFDKDKDKYWNQLIIPGKSSRRFPSYRTWNEEFGHHEWTTFKDVKLFTSDPWGPSFTSDLGELSNLKIENNEGDLISLDKDAPLL